MIPTSLTEALEVELTSLEKENVSVQHFSPASGGCINNGGRIVTSKGTYFLKWNDADKYPGMFKAEAKGLRTLGQVQAIDVPEVVLEGKVDSFQYLLLRFIQSSQKSSQYWRCLGEKLALLHNHTRITFGFDSNNYIGSLRQENEFQKSWVTFFISKRLEPQLVLAEQRGGVSSATRRDLEKLYVKLPELLCEEKPSLVHGDLWSGNVMVNEKGEPALIDPAVYYGHREADLAMSKLFGGFADEFYQAYQSSSPLQPGFEERFDLYNLYPLLVHVNLFGGGYLSQVSSILRKFV